MSDTVNHPAFLSNRLGDAWAKIKNFAGVFMATDPNSKRNAH